MNLTHHFLIAMPGLNDPNFYHTVTYICSHNEHIGVATSLDIFDAIANGKGSENTFITLGYAGWSAGQLEKEIQDNIWLSDPAESHIIFDTPVKQRWNSAANLLGIDIDQLSSDVGHT